MNTTAKELMKRWAIDEIDAVRIVLEGLEKMEAARNESRTELMKRLRRMVDEGVRGVLAAERTESFEVAAWRSVEARMQKRPMTRRDLRCFVRRMMRVKDVAGLPLRGMGVEDCRRLLGAAFGASASSYKKGRAILHSIFSFGIRRGWCDANPVDKIEAPEIREKTIVPLSPKEVERLEATALLPEHRSMRFSLHLMLYSGLRPYEVRRLEPEDICRETREIIIRPVVSKTGGGRVVPLRSHALKSEMMIPGNWEVRWRRLRRAAGFTRWSADVCRHTFASYHAAYFRDLAALQSEMGHMNLHLLRSRYVSPIRSSEARLFWRRIEQKRSGMAYSASRRGL